MIIYDSFIFKRLTDSELIKLLPEEYITDYDLDSFCCEYFLCGKKIAMYQIHDLNKNIELNKVFMNPLLLN